MKGVHLLRVVSIKMWFLIETHSWPCRRYEVVVQASCS